MELLVFVCALVTADLFAFRFGYDSRDRFSWNRRDGALAYDERSLTAARTADPAEYRSATRELDRELARLQRVG